MQQNIQLAEFEVQGLFGRYHHHIKFPVSEPDKPQPSLGILHGPNGVGKTTVLRMLYGFDSCGLILTHFAKILLRRQHFASRQEVALRFGPF